MKKVIITVIVLVIVILLGWWFFLRETGRPGVERVPSGSPFGSGVDGQVDSREQIVESEENFIPSSSLSGEGTKLFQISNTPVAGFVALINSVRYVDRAAGHIYQFNPATLERTKITNQTLPKIYEAQFRADGDAVLLRYLRNGSDTVENLSLVLTPPTSTSTTLHRVTSTLLRGYAGPVAINSPFTNWAFSLGNKVVAYTKPSSGVPGYAYTVANGNLSKILGPLNGLMVTTNNVGNRVAYSYVEDGTTKLFSKNLTSGNISEILPATLAEKCVWSTKYINEVYCGAPTDNIRSNEPDNWYQGETHFSDRLWRFDTDSEIAEILIEPKSSLSIDIDVYQPKLSPNEDYLIFINKNDLSLWVLKLENI